MCGSIIDKAVTVNLIVSVNLTVTAAATVVFNF